MPATNDPPVEAAMPPDLLNIPDNVLAAGTRRYDQSDRDDLFWLFGWARAEGHGRERLCQLLDCDWSTIARVAQGKYPSPAEGGTSASIAAFMAKVHDLRRRVDASAEPGFVSTVVTDRITSLLDYALDGNLRGGRIVAVVGPTGRSKTETLRHWASHNNHGKSVYVDCPVSRGQRALLLEIARTCGIGMSWSTSELDSRICKAFNRRRILILDEVGRLMPAKSSGAPAAFEFVRRLHDTTHCAVAISLTYTGMETMRAGRLAGYFEQFLGRTEMLYIPPDARHDECHAVCAAFVKSPSRALVDLAHRIANTEGRLRVLFDLLEKAAVLADNLGERLGERHLLAARDHRANRNTWPEDER